MTHTLRARVLWGFLGAGRPREGHRATRGRPSASGVPGAASSPGNALRRGSLRRACPFLPLGYLRPARGWGRRVEGGAAAPAPGCPSLRSPPGGSHLPLISCVGASFLSKPLDT